MVSKSQCCTYLCMLNLFSRQLIVATVVYCQFSLFTCCIAPQSVFYLAAAHAAVGCRYTVAKLLCPTVADVSVQPGASQNKLYLEVASSSSRKYYGEVRDFHSPTIIFSDFHCTYIFLAFKILLVLCNLSQLTLVSCYLSFVVFKSS